MKENLVHTVVVVFNKKVSDSLTVSGLMKHRNSNLDIIIADNSTADYGNRADCEKAGLRYVSMEGNKGLSKAYNRILDILEPSKEKDNEYVVWFDDDTDVTGEYISELCEALNNKQYSIFVPTITGQNGVIYSPNEVHFFKNDYVLMKNKEVRQSLFNAINSCLAVKLSVYVDYRYDEKLFLDMVDQKFFDDMRRRNIKCLRLKSVIYQSFSQRVKNPDKEKMKIRYKLRIKDLSAYCSESRLLRIKGTIKGMALSFEIALKCRSLELFCYCVKQLCIYMF